MDDVAEKIIAILRKYTRVPDKEIDFDTKLKDLEIESIDLVSIIFDIEDRFEIQIPYNANEGQTDFETVKLVVEKVIALLAAKQQSNAAA